MQNSSSTDDASFIYAFNIIGEMFIAVLSIIGNALVLYLISRDKQLQTVTNYFIASLAVADLLVSTITKGLSHCHTKRRIDGWMRGP